MRIFELISCFGLFRVYIANTFTTLIDRFTSDAFQGFDYKVINL